MRLPRLRALALTTVLLISSVVLFEVVWLIIYAASGSANTTKLAFAPERLNGGMKEAAPEFCLQDPSGTEQFCLSSQRETKMVVLIFGSFT